MNLKKLITTVLVGSAFIHTYAQQTSLPSIDINDNLTAYITDMETYFNSLTAQGTNVEELAEYKNYNRFIRYVRHTSGYPNFSMADYGDDFRNWAKIPGNYFGCVINEEYPFLAFNEVGPTDHVDRINPTVSSRGQGTGQIHYLEFDYTTFDPSNPDNLKMLACSNYGGLFKTDNNGMNWGQAGSDNNLPSTSVSSVAISPYSSDTWYLTTGNGEFLTTASIVPGFGVWRTIDGGSSYDLISVPTGSLGNSELYSANRSRKIIALENGGLTRLIVASDAGLFECVDADVAFPVWAKIASGKYYDIEVKPNEQNIIFASGDNETPLIRYNVNSTAAPIVISQLNFYNNLVAGSGDLRRTTIEFCNDVGDQLFVMVTESPGANSGRESRLYRYDLNLEQFIEKLVMPVATNDPIMDFERAMGWAISPKLSGGDVIMAFGNVNRIWLITGLLDNSMMSIPNPNIDFVIMENQIHDDHHFMKFNPIGTELYVGNDGGLFRTVVEPVGTPSVSYDWENLNNGLAVSTAYSLSTSQNSKERNLMAGFQDEGNIFIRKDVNNNWFGSTVGITGDGAQDYINPVESDKMLCMQQTGTGTYTDDRWQTNYNLSLPGAATEARFEGNPLNVNELYGATPQGLKKATISGLGTSNFNTLWSELPIESTINPSTGYSSPQNVYNVWTPKNPRYSDYIYVLWVGGLNGRTKVGVPADYPPELRTRIYRSTTGGGANVSDWELVYTFDEPRFGVLALDYNDPNIFWVADGSDNIVKVDLNVGSEIPLQKTGLPSLYYNAIEDIEYVRGSNDGLLVATKVGLYYTDETNYPTEWKKQCGLPNTPINDIEVDYCRHSLFVATYGRGIWEADLDIVQDKPFTITSNYTMTGNFYPGTDVVVEPGATLTVEGKLYMPIGGKVIVKPGARLTVNGGTITNACGSLWAGIQVWGDNSLSQFGNNQGEVILSQGATIEHAEVAVALWKPNDFNSTGGIIRSYNSTFLNNKKDVEFINYSNDENGQHYANKSIFIDTEFNWDDDFRREWPLGHVTLYKVDGVTFSGCLFADSRTNPDSRYHFDNDRTNSGIFSIDAKYRVIGHCNGVFTAGCDANIESASFTPTRFENLDFGIHAANSTTEYSVSVDRCVFENNLYGALYVGLNSSNITRSKFKFNTSNNNFLAYTQYGMHLVRSKELRIEENEFENFGTSNTTAGIVCSDLGESEEQIYKNSFVRMDFGNYAQGKNRNLSGLDGLQYLCNDNASNVYDHLVVGTLWGGSFDNTNGVRKQNGFFDLPSSVTFSMPPLSGPSIPLGDDYNNQSYNEVTFYYKSAIPAEDPDVSFGPFTKIAIALPEQCPTNFSSYPIIGLPGIIKGQLVTDFNEADNLLLTKRQEYANLLDGGDTQDLLAQIANLAPNNKHQLRSTLLAYSPYLSEEVIRATADNHPSLYPHPWVKELVENNLDVARSADFMTFLQIKQHPLPPGMINSIEAQLVNADLTDKTIRESEISKLNYDRAFSADMLIRSIQHDTDYVDTDSLRYWMLLKDDVLAATREVDSYLQDEDYTKVTSLLSKLNSAIPTYPNHLKFEILDFIALKSKLVGLLSKGGRLSELNPDDLSFLRDMAENGVGLARYQAQEILCFFYGECDAYLIDTPTVSKSSIKINEETNQTAYESSFKIYPDPANDWLAVEFEYATETTIRLYDLQGRLVIQQNVSERTFILDLTNLPNATYIIEAVSIEQDVLLGRQKVVVQH